MERASRHLQRTDPWRRQERQERRLIENSPAGEGREMPGKVDLCLFITAGDLGSERIQIHDFGTKTDC